MSVSEFWESTYRDIFNFIKAYNDKREFDIEQGWDYTRHIMWASMQPNSTKEIKVSSIIRLKRDGPIRKELSGYEQQELDKWSAQCDEEMKESGFVLVDWDGNVVK